MTWLTWRLQRTELLLLGAIMAVLVGMLVQSHADVVASQEIPTRDMCVGPVAGSTTEGLCMVPTGWVYKLVRGWLSWFAFLPLLAALLLALPIVIELENGTYRLAWTQGVTRGQWARIKLVLLTLSGVVFATVFALAFHWWSSPMDQSVGRLGNPWYDLRGTLPVGYTVFAIGLMLAIGSVTRRVVLAILFTSLTYVVIRIPFNNWIRWSLIEPVTAADERTFNASKSAIERAEGGSGGIDRWMLSQHYQAPTGKLLSQDEYRALCGSANNGGKDEARACIEANGLELMNTFHPASHYWPLQFAETAIYLGAGLLLIGVAAWYILRRIEQGGR